jgi:Icc-related predicted phosphoesterase
MDSQDRALLEQQLKRIITKLFKDFLVISEDVRQDHLVVMNDISLQFPAELVQRWNYLDLPRYSRLRKKILDAGNDSLREMHSILDNFSVTLDNRVLSIKNYERTQTG